MRIARFGAATALGVCLLSVPVAAQPAGDLDAVVEPFAEASTAGLPGFIVDSATACFARVAAELPADQQQLLIESGDFIAGINAIAEAAPDAVEPLFASLDDCGGTVTAGAVMWNWVGTNWPDATEAERTETGKCLLEAIDRLSFAAKRGMTNFRFGDYPASIEAMLRERPDLAGDFGDDWDRCTGLPVPPRPF